MNDLRSVSAVVQFILARYEKARNSDNLLYLLVCEAYARAGGIDFSKISATDFLIGMNEYGFPPFETVRRARQRVQQKNPELAASDRVQKFRAVNEAQFRAFAKDGAGVG